MPSTGVSLMGPKEWDRVKRLDALHQIKTFYMTPDDPYHSHRYEERADMYCLRSWNEATKEVTYERPLTERPDWLSAIINVAAVAGHLQRPPRYPPTCIVWFRTDGHHNLVDFIDFTKA